MLQALRLPGLSGRLQYTERKARGVQVGMKQCENAV